MPVKRVISEKQREYFKRHYWENRELHHSRYLKRRASHVVTDTERERSRINGKRYRERHRNNPKYLIRKRIASRIRHALTKAKSDKLGTSMRLAGCSRDELRAHIESLFQPGMTWENAHLWHVDHIIPCSCFDLSKLEEQLKCFHFTNLQPMWARDNLRKQDFYNGKSMGRHKQMAFYGKAA